MSIKYRHNERLKSMTSQGYKVLYDPPADCNCQFSSVAFALRDLGFFKSENTFRNDVISYMDTYEVQQMNILWSYLLLRHGVIKVIVMES